MKSEEIIANFKKGKIGIFPTDTAFGIGCRMDDPKAVGKVFELRKRPLEKSMLILVSSIEMARRYIEIDTKVSDKLIKKYWPGGLTIVFKCKVDNVPDIVRSNGNTLAVRIPNHKELIGIIDALGVPIVAPSANFSGKKTPFKLSDVDKSLLKNVDFVMEGMCTIKGVSTIVDTTTHPWKIIRDGVVKIKNLL